MTSASASRRGPGRPSATDDAALRTRNLRWFFVVDVLKERPEDVAAAEPTPVHPETVRRGVESARALMERTADGRESRELLDLSALNTRRCGRAMAPGRAKR